MKYSMFIGRWQTWHDGHQWLIDQRLKEGKNVCIAVREVSSNENNPRPSWEVMGDLKRRFLHDKRVKIIMIPDIESINYGRDVGYEVIEHVPSEEVKRISGTKIRGEEEHGNWENEGGSNLDDLPKGTYEGGHY